MPAELMDYAGLYGDSTSAVMLTVTADGVLSTGNAPCTTTATAPSGTRTRW